MSHAQTLSVEPFALKKAFLPEADVARRREYVSTVGCLSRSVQTYQPDTATNQTVSWSVTTPSPYVVVGKMWMAYRIQMQDLNSPNAIAGAIAGISSTANFTLGNQTGENVQGGPIGAPVPPGLGTLLIEGPRAWALQNSTSSSIFQINGISFPLSNLSEILPAMQTCACIWDSDGNTCPSQRDRMQNYTMNGAPGLPGYPLPFNFGVGSQFTDYTSASFDHDSAPRNARCWGASWTDAQPGGIPCSIAWSAVEQVLTPATSWYPKSRAPGLFGVSNFTLQLQFSYQRFWSSSLYYASAAPVLYQRNMAPGTPAVPAVAAAPPAPAIPAVAASSSLWAAGPMLIVEYFTPSPLYEIPKLISTPCYEVEVYKSQGSAGNVTTGPPAPVCGSGGVGNAVIAFKLATNQVTTPLIQLKSIPDKMLIFVKPILSPPGVAVAPALFPNPSFLSPQSPDTFAIIDSLSVSFNNTSGIFSQYTADQLYTLSTRNGSKLTFPEHFCGSYGGQQGTYIYTTGPTQNVGPNGLSPQLNQVDFDGMPGPGSVVVLAGSDLPSDGTYGTGSLGLFNFQATVGFASPHYTSVQWACDVVVIRDGILSYDGSSGVHQKLVGAVGTSDLLAAPVVDASMAARMKADDATMFGGSVLGDIWEGVKSVARHLGPAARIVSRVSGLVPGYGQPVSAATGALASALGSGRRRASSRSRRGGALLSHSQLADDGLM